MAGLPVGVAGMVLTGVACRLTTAWCPPRGIADGAGAVAGAHQGRSARGPTCRVIGPPVRVTAARSPAVRAVGQPRAAYAGGWPPEPGGRPAPARIRLERRFGGDARQQRNVILIDTSAWVEFLRDTGSDVSARVDAEMGGEIAICDAIHMEVLAGARDESHLEALRGLLARASVLPTEPTHYDEAATLYRRCRREGETVRRLIDCLIAAVAIGAGVPVLHRDDDFDVLARHTELDIVR